MISLLQLDWPLQLAVVAILLFAGLVHGTLGLGVPMVATPMLAVFFDVRSAILITLLPTVAVNIVSILNSPNSRESVRRFYPLVVFTTVGSVAGAAILAFTDPAPFRIILAGLILLYLWTNVAGRLPKSWLASNVLVSMIGFGLLAGLSGGTTNVMVAILIVFFLSLEIPRNTMVPALNSCFLVGKLSQIIVLAAAGLVTLTLLYETAPLAIAAIISLLIGQRLRERIPVETYRRVLHGLLIVLAGILVVQFSV